MDLFILSIIAGIMIGIGGLVNLSIGGVAGAIVFSVGLLTIIYYQFALFTGKAGLFIQKRIKLKELLLIWFGNFVGSAAVGMIPLWYRPALCQAAKNIVRIRMTNDIWLNFVLGILCGILMYAAVTHSEQIIFVILCVAAFILAGANHCVADMFYCWSSGVPAAFLTLIPTTIGNFVGCNLIPTTKKETS